MRAFKEYQGMIAVFSGGLDDEVKDESIVCNRRL